jgi:hypothetical protein
VLKNLAKYHTLIAETAPHFKKLAAKVDAHHAKQRVDESEIEIRKDKQTAIRLAADKAYHQAQVNHFTKSLERRK